MPVYLVSDIDVPVPEEVGKLGDLHAPREHRGCEGSPCVRTRRVQRIGVAIRAGRIRVVRFALVVMSGVAIPAAAV